jgi:hypothetical protein
MTGGTNTETERRKNHANGDSDAHPLRLESGHDGAKKGIENKKRKTSMVIKGF